MAYEGGDGNGIGADVERFYQRRIRKVNLSVECSRELVEVYPEVLQPEFQWMCVVPFYPSVC